MRVLTIPRCRACESTERDNQGHVDDAIIDSHARAVTPQKEVVLLLRTGHNGICEFIAVT